MLHSQPPSGKANSSGFCFFVSSSFSFYSSSEPAWKFVETFFFGGFLWWSGLTPPASWVTMASSASSSTVGLDGTTFLSGWKSKVGLTFG